MSRLTFPATGPLLFPLLLLGCVEAPVPNASEASSGVGALAQAPASSAELHGAYAHLDDQRIDAWWTEVDGERGTATLAVRASTASDNTYEVEIRALFGPLERSWTVVAPPVAPGEIFELALPLARAAGLDPLQVDYTTELLVQVRAYDRAGALRDSRPLPVRHLLVDDGDVVPLTRMERAALAPRGVRADAAPVAASFPSDEPTVETRVLPPVSISIAR